MFYGTFTPKLLASGQVVLPAKIRAGLKGNKAIVTTGYDKCVYGFSIDQWQKMADQELIKPLSTIEGRQVRQKMFAAAEEVDLDAQGRFVINENLRKYAEIASNMVVIGAGDHFEIWSEEEWGKNG